MCLSGTAVSHGDDVDTTQVGNLHNTTDQWFKAVLSRFIELTAKGKANPLLHSRKVLDSYGVPAPYHQE